jgi:selT/selW/selH-like putative selenoprotein
LKKELGIEATLVPGSGGIFDVILNGEIIFSKHNQGRFPLPGEIIQKIKP